MNTKEPSEKRSLIVQAIIGGIIGGIIVDTFLLIALHVSPLALEARNAALLAGPGASPVLGLIAHFAIAIAWAVTYAYAFNALGRLQNWVLGTIVLGITVNAVMNLAITLKTGAPWGAGFVADLITNVIFYALPVAAYLALRIGRP
jgi:hypothetical protein